MCEDNNINAEIVCRILKKVQIETDVANNGLEGVKLLIKSNEYKYDAILMDIRMPVLDGISAAKKIRNLSREDAKSIPIIALTANAYDEEQKKAIEAGMNEHLSKPIDVNVLYETLAKYIH